MAEEAQIKELHRKSRISISKPIYDMIKEAKKGTNLTENDIVNIIIKQYFLKKMPQKRHT